MRAPDSPSRGSSLEPKMRDEISTEGLCTQRAGLSRYIWTIIVAAPFVEANGSRSTDTVRYPIHVTLYEKLTIQRKLNI